MPYNNIQDLPKNLQELLPDHAQKIYIKAYNNAEKQYENPEKRRSSDDLETVAHKVAWQAVKQEYKKNEDTGKWERK